MKTPSIHKYRRPKSVLKKRLGGTTLFGLFLWLFLHFTYSLSTPELPKEDGVAELYSNQTRQDLRQTYLSAIQETKQSLLFLIYSLRDRQIIDALRSKAEAGAEVTVICDREASARVAKTLGPHVRTHYRTGSGLMHQKILVADHQNVWIGSANMTGESLRHHGNLIMGVHSPNLASAIEAHASSMLSENPSLSPQYTGIETNGQHIELSFLPTDKEALQRLLRLINSAKKTVRIAMFTWTHPELTQAVIQAHQRGVQIQAVLDKDSAHGSSEEVYQQLFKAHVPVALSNTTALLHHKMMWIDDTILVHGSANWTRAAFKKNDDCFVIINPLSTKQQELITSLWTVITQESIVELK